MADVRATILLAAYNRLPLLKEAIASALAQDADDFEVLVIDDGSGDETREWLDAEAERDAQLRVVHQPNSGVATARQNGVIEARGEFICILDSDDCLVPGALRRLLTEFEQDPSLDLVYCMNTHLQPNGTYQDFPLPVFESNDDMIRAIFLRPRLPLKHSGTIYRRSEALALGGYDTTLPIKIDIDFFLKYLAAGKRLRLINEPLVLFRMHRDSISAKRLLGIRIYNQLADRYGPHNPFTRIRFKATRAAIEMAKLAYLFLRMRKS
jgi:glycosyltransferase involved in cell wall biosynthesis